MIIILKGKKKTGKGGWKGRRGYIRDGGGWEEENGRGVKGMGREKEEKGRGSCCPPIFQTMHRSATE